ncbi:TRAP transporter substrate-binding protein [Thermus antranikianii]|uniref:Extracytoplasmic solute receptor protein n=1 Tax=Thermus antranikianii TaxID=88190 RepID=A0ABY7RSC2_9DEIN|nr:TRAP transporter substrate-binding protein [Thermus antranikianii]WCM40592.1 twin-arginine translocation signal domain-containing protein [Thermus antranikianii]
MKRRDFLKKAGIGVAASAAFGPVFAQAQPTIRWRLASSFPKSLDTIYGAAEVLAERVSALTGGRFQIRPYQAGEIVPGLQVMDAVQQGTVEMGHTASYYFVGKAQVFAFDTAVPFGLTARQQNAWMYHAGGIELFRPIFADFGIIQFPGGNTGVQMGGWFRKEIKGVADLKGLKMRIPGPGGQVMSRLGVVPQVLAGGDIYPALERGVVDAAEWVGPYDDEKLGFYKVAKYYYYPGWHEPGPMLSFYVNLREWGRLPKDYQQAIEVAAAEANLWMMAKYDRLNAPALQRLIRAGVRLRKWPAEVMRAAQKAAFEWYEEEAAKDATYRKVYTAWKAFREEQYRWFGVAELGYEGFAFPAS